MSDLKETIRRGRDVIEAQLAELESLRAQLAAKERELEEAQQALKEIAEAIAADSRPLKDIRRDLTHLSLLEKVAEEARDLIPRLKGKELIDSAAIEELPDLVEGVFLPLAMAVQNAALAALPKKSEAPNPTKGPDA